jgi:hypothetical protein
VRPPFENDSEGRARPQLMQRSRHHCNSHIDRVMLMADVKLNTD